MDEGVVTIKYSPVKWAQSLNGNKSDIQSYAENNTASTPASPSKNNYTQIYTRKKQISPLSTQSFERPVQESINNMKNYANASKLNSILFQVLEQSWYGDLLNVAQRLKLLRDAYKVIQTVRKKKALGLKVDFKPIFDTKCLRIDKPNLDDESQQHNRTEDEYEDKVREYPPPTRRGRPRKKHGRERKPLVGRSERVTPLARTRLGRRLKERSSLPLASTSVEKSKRGNTSNIASTSGYLGPSSLQLRLDPHAPTLTPTPNFLSSQLVLGLLPLINGLGPISNISEPQGPPLMYLPPILPSQRLQLVQGIPPYKHMKEIKEGVILGDTALPFSKSNGIMPEPLFANQSRAQHEQVGLTATLEPMIKILDSADDSGSGTAALELSAVFRQLTEGQASLPSFQTSTYTENGQGLLFDFENDANSE